MLSLLHYLRILSHLCLLVKWFFTAFFIDFYRKQSIIKPRFYVERSVCFDSFMCICR